MIQLWQRTMYGAACTMDDVTYRRGQILLEQRIISYNRDQHRNFFPPHLGIGEMMRSHMILGHRPVMTEDV